MPAIKQSGVGNANAVDATTTMKPEDVIFLGMSASVWMMFLIGSAITLFLIISVVVICYSCRRRTLPRNRGTGAQSSVALTVAVPVDAVEKETLIEKSDILVQMPDGQLHHFERRQKSSRRSNRTSRKSHGKTSRRVDSAGFEDIQLDEATDPFFTAESTQARSNKDHNKSYHGY
uniref:Uncharacterized protein n=1 Tax=Panagrolaimus sp. JU765 TaxID=591449 RepID=A0AC34QGB9_9BILA